MSAGGQTKIAETSTEASKVLFINSGDATTILMIIQVILCLY